MTNGAIRDKGVRTNAGKELGSFVRENLGQRPWSMEGLRGPRTELLTK